LRLLCGFLPICGARIGTVPLLCASIVYPVP
jgi:hypothetical protein